jgi:hypothetical protein
VQVADPFIELHTGPGRGYPVFHVEERGAWIDVIRRKTGWYKVRTRKGQEGWVWREQLAETFMPSGAKTRLAETGREQFADHDFAVSAMGGQFEGAEVMTVAGSAYLTPNLSVEVAASKILADFSSSTMADVSVLAHPFPEWRISPFFALGTGVINTNPNVTLVEPRDKTDRLSRVGLGVRVYLTSRFEFRAQYNNYVIFQSVDDNQEVDEWKIGLTAFF